MKSIRATALAALAFLFQLPVRAEAPVDTGWHREPFRIKAGDQLLNTNPADYGGHAAPFLADIDGDGRRDLTVGSIQGRFHFYRNVGTDAAPRFDARSVFLRAGVAGEIPARVPNFCCVASGPQILDIDGDGIVDLTSGSYAPAELYWFKGRGDGTFHARQTLTDTSVRPVLPMPEVNPYEQTLKEYRNLMTNLAWTHWDDNESLDLIVGNYPGQLFVRLNAEGIMGGPGSAGPENPPIASQPMFMPKQFQAKYSTSEIRIDGGNAVPELHAAPAVADWDGDGLWDILVGTESGRVYWLKNTGKPGAPVFNERQELLGPGSAGQWVEQGKDPVRGIRAQIQAVDYNLDGKLDLLVGEWLIMETPRPDLTARERREMEVIRRELHQLDTEMGYKPDYLVRYKLPKYQENKEALKRAQALETELTRFLVQYDHWQQPDYLRFTSFQRQCGLVSVFLRK